MKNTFEFNAVGQGLFYTGELNGGEYKFVYDCGTESKDGNIIHEIKKHFPSCDKLDVIDFLVISHLHKDHISGLIDLKKNSRIKKIYLPYLGEKNLFLTQFLIAHAVIDLNKDERLNLFHFLYLLYDDYIDSEIEFIGNSQDSSAINNFLYSKTKIDCNGMWNFYLFNRRQSDKTLYELDEKVKLLLKNNSITSIEDLLNDNEGIEEIKKIYCEIFGKGNAQNLTSTVMVHYPQKLNINYIFSGLQNITISGEKIHCMERTLNDDNCNGVATIL
jgi:predicted transposase YbfD/YdcC